MKRKATIMVSGMIAADPFQGGATWAVLQYVLGLRELGHHVYFVEPVPEKALKRSPLTPTLSPGEREPQGSISDLPDNASCAAQRPTIPPLPPGEGRGEGKSPAEALPALSLHASQNAQYFREVMEEFDLLGNSALLLAGTRQTFGLPYERLRRIARRTDLLLNISGMLQDEDLTSKIPIRVYLDLDPAFIQLWSAVQGIDMRFAGHTHFLTIGQAIGEPDCPVPSCGLSWLKTLQPIVLSRWPQTEPISGGPLTTVGNWRGYGSIEHQGVFYGQKAHSLRQFLNLPALTGEEFLLALAIHANETKDLTALADHGWKLVDPARVARTPASYQQFIRNSKAELGIAKSGYVASRCGWFSDRSLCYLASGRPVIAQDTGFSRHLPTGEGLFAFRTSEEVCSATQQLRSDYPKHSRRARALAEELFDSNKVLPRVLDQVGI